MLVCNGFNTGFQVTCNVCAGSAIEAVATETHRTRSKREAVRDAGLKCVPVPVDEDA